MLQLQLQNESGDYVHEMNGLMKWAELDLI